MNIIYYIQFVHYCKTDQKNKLRNSYIYARVFVTPND